MTESTETGATASFRERWGAVNRLTRDVRPRVAMVAIAAFATGLVEAAFLVAVARIGLVIAEGGSTVTLTRGVTIQLRTALVVAAAVLVIRLIVALLSVRVQAGVSYRVTTALRTRLAHAYLRSSWAIQQQQPQGTLQQLVVAFPNQAGGLVGTLASSGGATLSLLAMLLVAGLVDPAATGIIVAALIVLSSILRPVRQRIEHRSQIAIERQVQFADSVAEISSLGLEIQTFGVREQAEETIDDLIHDYASADRRVSLFSLIISPIYVTLAYAAVLLALALTVRLSAESLASVGAAMLIMLRSLGYGQQMQSGSAALRLVLPFLQRLESKTQLFGDEAATYGDQTIESVGRIEFRDVCFSYDNSHDIIDHLSFSVEPGEVIGVVGPSGSGKSTLMQLVLGLRRPNSGEILFSNIPLASISEVCLRSHMAFVPQQPALTDGSLRENIVFFRNYIDETQIRNAIKASHLEPLLDTLPSGLDSNLGTAGHRLSGGQRQRITIARALVAAPEVIIMDEPTSALDDEAEAVIRETISELAGAHTVFVIAHRKSTIDACDRLIHLGTSESRTL